MKIVFYSRYFYPHIGGVEKHVENLSKLLLSAGHQVTVITLRYSSNLKKFDTYNNIKIIRLNPFKIRYFGLISIWLFQLFKIIAVIKSADVVHCHDVFLWYFPFRFIFFKKPVFTTFHGYEKYPLTVKLIFLRKVAEKLSDGNICVGDFMKKWYGTKPTLVTYGAVEDGFLKTKSISFKYDAIFWGRLDESTGILQYQKTVQLLKARGRRFSWLVLGDGKYRKNIDNETVVLKPVRNPIDYIKSARFAFVSRYLSIMEALALKKIVIAFYDNPIKEDYLKMASFSKYIIIVKDENQAADQIIRLINNPAYYHKMQNQGYRWVQKRTWNQVLDLYFCLWSWI